MVKVKQFDNGLRLVTHSYEGLRSVSVGFFVAAGSGFENAQNNGISHFTEHVMYKGTAKLNAKQIAEKFEDYGAATNAYTSKEMTCYYFKSIDERLEDCFSLLSHIFFESTFDDTELDKERQVIVEEINMVEDAPDDICLEKLAKVAYSGTPLAQTILGSKENVLRFKGDDVRKYIGEMYTPDSIVISMCGNVNHDDAVKLVEKYVLPLCKNKGKRNIEYASSPLSGGFEKYEKDFEQINFALSVPGVHYDNEKATVQSIASCCLGGGMSSRLFQVMREQKGLVYNVYAAASTYNRIGTFGVYFNTSGKNFKSAIETVKEEIMRLSHDGFTSEEIERAKSQLSSGMMFSLENTLTTMQLDGKYVLSTGKLFDLDKKLAEISSVTKEQIDEYCKTTFDLKKISASYVGKAEYIKGLDVYKMLTE